MFKDHQAICAIAGGAMVAVLCTGGASAGGGYKQVHSFCRQVACRDGAMPQTGLVADSKGNFYGTTFGGGQGGCGAYGCGTAFELSPKRDGKYKISLLYRFCNQGNCDDGGLPMSGLIVDKAGNLYGTANVGGGYGAGSVFELVLNSDGTRTYTVLHQFWSESNCTDGAGPEYDGLTYKGQASGARYDGTSPLYGTVIAGGSGGVGVVYELKPGSNGTWNENVLYNFCGPTRMANGERRSNPPSGGGCAEGDLPQHALLLDSAGNLYGTTEGGGSNDTGVIFELSKIGKTWSETVLYNICAGGGSCTDGVNASSPLVMDAGGNLYSVMANGGSSEGGLVFKLTPNGTNSTYSVLYDFCAQTGCTDGEEPWGPLLMDSTGNVIGTTEIGGAYGLGTVYEFSGGSVSVLHSFCSQSGCTDGAVPSGGVIQDASGNLYGTASDGCDPCTAYGSVFRLTR